MARKKKLKEVVELDEIKEEEVVEEREKKFVVQIREKLDNKKYVNSVTKIIDSDKAEEIYKMLEE